MADLQSWKRHASTYIAKPHAVKEVEE